MRRLIAVRLSGPREIRVSKAERAERDSRQSLMRKAGGGRLPRGDSACGDESDRLGIEAASRETDDLLRRRVEPLEIVDRDQHVPVFRERPKGVEER
jgi:hypothetical protein